jgi:hypothetical protein
MANKIILKKTSTASKVPLSTDLEVGEIAVNLADQKLYSKNAGGTVILVGQGTGGAGDVVGPASSTDNALSRFDGTTGKLIQNSTVVLDDNGNLSNVNSVGFDTTPATVPAVVGTMSWDDGDGVTSTLLKGGNVTLQNGTQEYARVFNDSGATLTIGQAVYISGAQGNRVAVKLARANLESTSFGTIGLVAETIANGAEGFIIVSGALYKLNTTGLTAGATVYLSPTTAGAITTTKPQAPNQLVVLGWVERVSSTVGSIYVKIDNGYELDELHDVQINSPQSGNLLIYDATTTPIGVWKNANITAGTGVSVTNGAGSITVANTGVTSAVAGTGISVSGATGAVTVTNTAPDQVVSLTGAGATTITGTYPSFTVSSVNTTYNLATSTTLGLIELASDTVQTTAPNAVTSTASRSYGLQVNSAGQGVINVPWTDTTYGLATTTVPGLIELGSDTVQTVAAEAVSATASRTYALQLNAAGQAVVNVPWTAGGTGTVTSVSALTLGTTGTDLSSTVANSTTTPVITLNVPTASATNRGALSSADWTTFNNKYSTGGALGTPSSGTLTNCTGLPVGGISATGTPSSTTFLRGDGSWATVSGGSGTVTSVGGTGTVNGITLTGTVTSSGNLTLGGTLSGVSLSTQVTGTLPIANGGTGETTRQAAMDALAGAVTSGQYLRGNGTDVVMSAIQAADVPTLNQNTTGSAATFTSTTQNSQFNSVGVGTAGSGTAGEIRATNNITAFFSSDRNLKENIKDVDNALEIVCSIGSKTFDWTDEYIKQHGGDDGYFVTKQSFGVIAQDVKEVFPQAVRTREDGTLAVDYEKLAVLSFGAIKELVNRIEKLEGK